MKPSKILTRHLLLRRVDIREGSEDLVWKRPKIYLPKRGTAWGVVRRGRRMMKSERIITLTKIIKVLSIIKRFKMNWHHLERIHTLLWREMRKTVLCVQSVGNLKRQRTNVCGFAISIVNDHSTRFVKIKYSQKNQIPEKSLQMGIGSVRIAQKTLLNASVAKRRAQY